MPAVKIDKVVSVSSEHPGHPASNIFTESDAFWTCSSKGEKQLSVIVQLQSSTRISSVHVGNYGSAFVEVLVGKATSLKDDDFKVLLLCSSLMTLQDSRAERNLKGVKMFTSDKLNSDTQTQFWDRLKVVCTQPFNNHLYGLTFLKISGDCHDVKTPDVSKNPLASLSIPSASSDFTSDAIQVGSFFKNRSSRSSACKTSTISQSNNSTVTQSVASELRAPSASVFTTPSKNQTTSDTSDNFNVSDSKPSRKTPKLEPGVSTSEKKKPLTIEKRESKAKRRSGDSESSLTETPKAKVQKQTSVDSTTKTAASTSKVKFDRFENLMRGVVFCLSGFVNPLRGDLRRKGLEMGAKYKQDWTPDCTHLVCAFANTPKFNQVKQGHPSARIVKKDWIEDCHQQRVRLNLTNYSMIPLSEQDKKEPEIRARDDTTEKAGEPENSENSLRQESETTVDEERPEVEVGCENQLKSSSTDVYDAETDSEYELDTEDVTLDTDPKNEEGGSGNGQTESLDKVELPPLPDFFKRRKFLLFGDFDTDTRRFLKRLIIAYNGVLLEYMEDGVDYVITNDSWSSKFDDVLEDNSSVQFVKPSWLIACDKMQKNVPVQYHLVAP